MDKKSYTLTLPLKGEPGKRFKQFCLDLSAGGFLALAENWKGRLRFNSYSMPSTSSGDSKKSGRESSIVAKATEEEISTFASSFNVAMALKDKDRKITLKVVPSTTQDCINVDWTLRLTVSITSLPVRMVWENFLSLAKSN